MLTRSHRLCSVALIEAALMTSHNLMVNPVSNVILLVATAIGASLPDIDEYESSVSRKSVINFSLFLRHRGITHSLLGWLVFSGLLYFLMNWLMPIKLVWPKIPDYWSSLWLGLIVGYFLHLVEDGFSKQGVQWLAPFYKNYPHHFLHYKVGGLFEKLIALISFLAILLMTGNWLYLLWLKLN